MAGRYPTPAGQKALESRTPKPAVKLRVDAPKMPPGLKPQVKKVWRILVKLLSEQGTIARTDVFALEMFCDLWVRRMECQEALQEGLSFRLKNGYRQQLPEVALLQKTERELRQLMVQFGMTPAARVRLQVVAVEERVDPTEKLEQRRFEKRNGMRIVGGS